MIKAKQNLIDCCGGKKIAVAVSGGMDSMLLITLVLGTKEINKSDVLIFNVNHNLRGNESHRDSKFVEEFAAKNNVRFKGVSVDINSLCAVSGRSVECEAREVRRKYFYELIKDGCADMVLTAHHAGDNAESVLMHMFRGCGIFGLKGMPLLSENGICRPLINTQKEDIEAYIAANKIQYVTDSSNADLTFDRNYVRHEIMPKILGRYAGAIKAINRLSEICAEYEYDYSSDVIVDKSTVKLGVFTVCGSNSADKIRAALAALGITSDITKQHIDSVKGLIDKQNGSRVMIGQGITVIREYDYLTFIKGKYLGVNMPPVVVDNLLGGGSATVLDKTVTFSKVDKINKGDFGGGVLYMDKSSLPLGAVLRKRQDGDVFTPFGGGTKKLKEYLIDKKIPLRERDKLICLCYNSTILAILGIEISEKVKVKLGSDIIKITLTEDDTIGQKIEDGDII